MEKKQDNPSTLPDRSSRSTRQREPQNGQLMRYLPWSIRLIQLGKPNISPLRHGDCRCSIGHSGLRL